jgi:hypothetical protein
MLRNNTNFMGYYRYLYAFNLPFMACGGTSSIDGGFLGIKERFSIGSEVLLFLWSSYSCIDELWG